MKTTLRFILALLFVLFASHVVAQTVIPDDYGTSGTNSLIIPGTSFVPSNSATGYVREPFLHVMRTGGGDSEFMHSLILPAGALIQSVTAYVHDTSGGGGVTLRMCIESAEPDTGTTQITYCDGFIGLPPVSTGASPGNTSLTLTPNRTFLNRGDLVDQFNKDLAYVIIVHLNTTDFSTWLYSVKVTWKRQISPAPASATFTDVPTNHPFFQFIEALAASGITAGCSLSPPQYCPDAPLTRGQMAVFLSRALGLHWVP